MKRILTKAVFLLAFAAMLGSTALADVAQPGIAVFRSNPTFLPVVLGILIAAIVVIVVVLVIHKRKR